MKGTNHQIWGTVSCIDQAIRAGEGHSARNELERLLRRKIPRELAPTFARLSLRAGHPYLGLRILQPWVCPSARYFRAPTAEEKVQYGLCLTQIGAFEEAEGILREVNTRSDPQALFCRAEICAARWDYASAIPLFTQYIRLTDPRSYENLSGRVNLATAYVKAGRFLSAKYLLRELLHETSVRRVQLLHGKALELSVELLIHRRKWTEAGRFLSDAQKALRHSGLIDRFLLRKWKAFLTLQGSSDPLCRQKHLHTVREQAARIGQWEAVRECDRMIALVFQDEQILWKVYFGTPFAHYRMALIRAWETPLIVPETYCWQIGDNQDPRAPVINAVDGTAVPSLENLGAGRSPHQLLLILSSDFYRPFRFSSLFRALFPTDLYNPLSSPSRVHRAVYGLREWFDANHLPLTIRIREGGYSLRATAPCTIEVSASGRGRSKVEQALARLKRTWSDRPFSLLEASSQLKISARTTLRVLEEGIRRGAITRLGKRAFARYRLTG